MKNRRRIQKPNIYTCIAFRNPAKAWDLLINEGYTNMPKEKNMIALGLANIVSKQGNSGLLKIKNIHPDKDLFMSDSNVLKSCDGCEVKRLFEEKYKSADSEGVRKFSLSEKNINILIMSGAAVFVAVSIILLIKNTK